MYTVRYDVLSEVIALLQPNITASRTRTEAPDLEKFNMHTQECYEIYCFLEGNADYFVEGTVYSLKSGDILILKKAEAHSLLIHTLCPYERIVVHFTAEGITADLRKLLCQFLDNRPLGRNNRYPAALFKNNNWQYYLKRIYSTRDFTQRQIYLSTLLYELWEAYPKICSSESAEKNPITDVIGYINDNLTENLSLELLCCEFFMSKAQLNRKFKKATGSTVWEYIMTKRLLLAKEYLQEGESPTQVCAKSGFNDYCSFYRAYKAKFGSSPKADQRHRG